MRTIAIINQKGGCGKTTCSINLAAALAQEGQRTLLVDMDPQSHCALGLAVPEGQVRYSTAELMRAGSDGSIAVADVVWQIARNFDLIPSSMGLAAIEAQLQHAPDKDRRLARLLGAAQDHYDFCVIDCPPSIGLLTFNALRAATEVIVPVETGYFSMEGAKKQHRTIEMLARRAGHNVQFSILPTMYDVRTKLAREILAEIKRHFTEHILPLVINFNAKLKEAASFGQPITEYDAASRGMKDFETLAKHLVAHPPPSLEPEPQPEPTEATGRDTPVVSRAAELVERARLLSQRTAEISARLSTDTDTDTGTPAPATTRPTPTIPRATPPAAPVSSPSHANHQDRATPAPAPEPTQTPTVTTPWPTGNTAPASAPAATPSAANAPAPTTPPLSTPAPGQSRAASIAASAATLTNRTEPTASAPASTGVAQATPPAPPRPAPFPQATPVVVPADAPPPPTVPAADPKQAKIASLYGVRKTHQGLLFVQPLNGADAMAIAADFNGWNPQQTRLTRNDELNVWQAVVPVPPGKYRYRLVIDGRWVKDPYNPTVEANPFGELNNLIEVKA